MDVLVIGAGLAGLACARTLAAAGIRVTVVDKGRGPGGRLATRRFAGGSFDTGAQFFSVRDAGFAAEVAAWEAAGLALRWCDGFPVHGGEDGRDGHPRWRVEGGMNRLAKHLAQGLTVLDRRTVSGLAPVGTRWHVTAAPGDPPDPVATLELLTVDAVVLTAPGPQAAALLTRNGLPLDPRLAAVRYDPCLCLLLDFPDAAGPLLPPPGALRVTDDAAIAWLASQRAKGLRAAGDGLVVHSRGDWAAAHYDSDQVLHDLDGAARALLPRLGVRAAPAVSQLKKWRYSLPTTLVDEPVLRVPAPGAGLLLVAGDSLGGRARVEGAWLSGMAAAAQLIAYQAKW